jgi:outer membrane protein assembly factor BamB
MIKELKVFPCMLANSSPLIVGDLVFAVTGNGTNEDEDPPKLPAPEAPSFIAVDKNSGKVKWKDASPGKNIMAGQWSSPTYAAPKGGPPQVIFPGGDGWLYSFEPETGKLIWKFNANPKNAIYDPKNMRISDKAYFIAAPVVNEDRLYIALGRNPTDGPGPGHLWCIDLTKKGDVSARDEKFDPKDPKNKDSALVWHFGGKIEPRPEKGREIRFGRTLSNATVHDGLLYITEQDGYFQCLDAKTGEHYYEVDLQSETWATPYWVDGKVFLGNEDGDLHVYEHGKKAKRLAKIVVGPSVKMPIKVVDGVIYVLTDSYLYAVGKK